MTNSADPKEFWTLQYREPLCGGNRISVIHESKLMDALAIFNTQESTSGFDTPIRATYSYGVNGQSYTFTLQGRYDVPRRI